MHHSHTIVALQQHHICSDQLQVTVSSHWPACNLLEQTDHITIYAAMFCFGSKMTYKPSGVMAAVSNSSHFTRRQSATDLPASYQVMNIYERSLNICVIHLRTCVVVTNVSRTCVSTSSVACSQQTSSHIFAITEATTLDRHPLWQIAAFNQLTLMGSTDAAASACLRCQRHG